MRTTTAVNAPRFFGVQKPSMLSCSAISGDRPPARAQFAEAGHQWPEIVELLI